MKGIRLCRRDHQGKDSASQGKVFELYSKYNEKALKCFKQRKDLPLLHIQKITLAAVCEGF